jgi:Family of unknown function (DUF6481)
MKSGTYKNDTFSNRLTSAANAKTALLERFRARPGPDDPAVIARRAAQAEIEAAREVRIAERKAAREAEAIRHAAEQAALAEEAKAKDVELQARIAEEAARAAERAAEAKAARDARYAARRARRR